MLLLLLHAQAVLAPAGRTLQMPATHELVSGGQRQEEVQALPLPHRTLALHTPLTHWCVSVGQPQVVSHAAFVAQATCIRCAAGDRSADTPADFPQLGKLRDI